MYVTKGMTSFRVYWKDMTGNLNYYFDEGLSVDDVLNESESNIKRMYMASFTVAGLEERVGNKWVKVDISKKYYKGGSVMVKRLNALDELKLEILKDLVVSEVEYCFDLNYNSDTGWTVKERILSLITHLEYLSTQEPNQIAEAYDEDYFSKNVHLELKRLYPKS